MTNPLASNAGSVATGPRGASSDPRHVAIIMDGNGRWATARGLPRQVGHERGVEALRRTVEAAAELGIEVLSVFSFSTENWRRPASEIESLFALLRAYVRRDLKRLVEDGVRIRVIGCRQDVPPDVLSLLDEAVEKTAENTVRTLVIAFNYGGRRDVTEAARGLAARVASGVLHPDEIDEATMAGALWTGDLPDPDLIIRTSGEFRLSNFFLWQAAYSELVFVDTQWPDFDRAQLESALEAYKSRKRRFGAVDARRTG